MNNKKRKDPIFNWMLFNQSIQICPMLLRVFINQGRHHQAKDYSRGHVPANEVQVYTWLDASLKELSGLVKEVNMDARRAGTVFDFAKVYPKHDHPNYRVQEIGSTVNGEKGPNDNRTLSQANFQIGDYLDIAVHPVSNGNQINRDRNANNRRQKMHRF
jgi:histone deacetylase complex subunit SAP18